MGDSPTTGTNDISDVDITEDMEFKPIFNSLNIALTKKLKEELEKRVLKAEKNIFDRINTSLQNKIESLFNSQTVDIRNDKDFHPILESLNLTLQKKVKDEVQRQMVNVKEDILNEVNAEWKKTIRKILQVQDDYDQKVNKGVKALNLCRAKEVRNILKDYTNMTLNEDTENENSESEIIVQQSVLQEKTQNELEVPSLLDFSIFSIYRNRDKGSNPPADESEEEIHLHDETHSEEDIPSVLNFSIRKRKRSGFSSKENKRKHFNQPGTSQKKSPRNF